MARSHDARQRRRQVPASRPAGRLARPARACVAAATVALAVALPLLDSLAGTGPARAQVTRVTRVAHAARLATSAAQPPREPLTLAVTSVSPSFAAEGRTVTISGRVRNLAAQAATGLSVRLLSSRSPLGSRLELRSYADGSLVPAEEQVSTEPVTLSRLRGGHSWRWSIRLPASSLGLSCFGVYPLTVEVGDAALDVARDPVPLPYWPATSSGCSGQHRPRPFAISWIWPLIDVPHQDACAGLIDDTLAARIAPDGRLGYLLAIGSRYSRQAGLTWAIDPSLLGSVQAMRGPYPVRSSASCSRGTERPASRDAARWLAALRKATAGQPLFLTPYADVDVAALAKRGNISDLERAFAAAGQAGHQILRRNPLPAPVPAGRRQLSAIAWPADGIASGAVLDTLAPYVSTVILAAPAISPVSYTPGAVTSKLTGIGTQLHILLADRAITTLLGTKQARSRKAGDVFAASQLYLAETAMIASEAPGNRRPVVVAPPRRWNPPRRLASGLLADTVRAPWLTPSTAGDLVTMHPEHLYPTVTQSSNRAELGRRLLRKVARLDHRIRLLQSIRVRPDPALNRAIFGIESSAWRGKAGRHARALLARATGYVRSQLRGLAIRGGRGHHPAYHVTFGGKTAPVNVVIHNDLRYPVEVGLRVEADNAKVTGVPGSIRVPALSYSAAVTLTVRVKGKQGRIRLSLIAPRGTRPAGQPLPASPLVIVVHPTNFGVVALIICAAALALFVIASATRAIRLGRPDPPSDSDDPDFATNPLPPDIPAGPVLPDAAVRSPRPDAPAGRRLVPGGPVAPAGYRPEAAGRMTRIPPGGYQDPGSGPEYADSVDDDRTESTSGGPPVAGQEPAAPSRRATEERP